MPRLTEHEHLDAVANWAARIRDQLAHLLERRNGEVHFRPSSGGIAMVGLLHDRPQRGKRSITNLARLAADFDAEFALHCVDCDQGRPTPEKQLQSFLIADAYRHDRRMAVLEAASASTVSPVLLEFITDELVIPTNNGKVVCDLLALRTADHATIPVVVELKSARDKARLVVQVEGYADFVDAHADGYAQIYSALLGRPVEFAAPCERWIVWPSAGPGPDRHEAELGTRGIRVVTYEQHGPSFTFCVGVPARGGVAR